MTEVGRGTENDNGAPGEDRHGHRCDDAVGGAVWDALAARTTEDRYNASVRLTRPIEAARARASSQVRYFAPCRRADRRVALGNVVHVDHNLR